MRAIDLVVGEDYRLRSTLKYGWVKVIKVLKPLQDENTNRYIVVKCEHCVNKGDKFGFIRYFKPCDIVRDV